MDKKAYDGKVREPHWQKFWEKEKIFAFDPDSKKPLFTIDTPPPTISGALHLGHIFSYTQAEVIARFMRMAGYNVRYPFGLDNNGLATERLVEKENSIRGRDLPLNEFIKICLALTEKYRKIFEDLWKKIGLSVDWRLEYSTIAPEVQKLVQTVFIELLKKGEIYRQSAPALYCTECQTSVAQAEMEDKEKESVFYDIVFRKKDSSELLIATTRPELLPACVSVFVHPKDKRYKNLVGETVETPLGAKVLVKADEKVSMEKGTGAVMCCTYGDETDVYWVKTHGLKEKIILNRQGKFINVELLKDLEGKGVKEGRNFVVEKLRKEGAIKAEKAITHDVGVHERCSTPIEIIDTIQWFIKILDKKEALLSAGQKINWYPPTMVKRYEDWTQGLKWDWSISRERFFGIPLPVYVCQKCAEIMTAEKKDLPFDPRSEKNNGKCPNCHSGELLGENLVLDTWFTSSLTPDINNLSPLNGKLAGKMYPMSMRPQAHDIIRTWALYTILMGLMRHDDIPWRDLVISGHVLVKKGEKISKKTGGGEYSPEDLIATHSADAVRFAMCSSSLGQDAYFDEGEVQMGKKLVTKIYNAGKFALGHLAGFKPETGKSKPSEASDIWITIQMAKVAANMDREFKKYEFSRAKRIFEDFFWNDFCDNYLEIAKARLYGSNEKKRRSAQHALYETYLGVLKMAAPFVPHITEEMYQKDGFFIKNEGAKSVHLSQWPNKKEGKIDLKLEEGARLMLEVISQIRKYKSEKRISLAADISQVAISCSAKHKTVLTPFVEDICAVIKASQINFVGEETKKASEAELTITL